MASKPAKDARYLVACAAAAAAVLAAYANHFHNSFHFDDWHTVQQNLFIRDLKNIPRFFTDAQTFSALPMNQSYRPLVTTTLAIDYRLGGPDPLWFHVDNFCYFAITCVLLLLLFRRLLGDQWLALFGAALYGLHAANAETVNYVISRSDILSTAGAVGCLYAYAASARARRLHLYLIPAVLGVLAKEQGAMAAPLLFLYIALIEQQRSLRELLSPRALWAALKPALPAFAACGAAALLTLAMAPSWSPGGTSRAQYAFTQPFVALHYALMFVLPVQLSADSDWTAVQSWLEPRALVGLCFLAAALWLSARASERPRTRPAALGLLWFFVALLPTSSIIPLAEVMNDHRMYFPFVGLALAAACGGGLLLERLGPRLPRFALAAIAVLILAGHAAGVHARNQVWRTEESLWRDVTEKSPQNPRGWMNYGLTFMQRGDYDGAEKCFRRGLELAPYYGYLHTNLAIVAGERGQTEVAEREFRTGVQLMPQVPVLRFYYARWLDKVGRDPEAVAVLKQALAMAPADSMPRELLLRVLAKTRAWTELLQAAQEALRIRGDDPLARSMLELSQQHASASQPPAADSGERAETFVDLSLGFFNAARYEDALRASERAIALRPDYAEAWNNKCAALNQLKRPAEAAVACEAALRLKPDFELARNNLAAARAAQR